VSRAGARGWWAGRRSTGTPTVALLVIVVALLATAGLACLDRGLTGSATAGWSVSQARSSAGAGSVSPVRVVPGVKHSPATPSDPHHRPSAAGGTPVRLLIPSLGLRAPVVPVRAVDRVLSPPPQSWIVGWWAAGARPGALRGPVVLSGHTMAAGGGAFGALDRLREGASITVVTDTGVVRYAVRRVWATSRVGFARWAPTLTASGGAARLVLVTCSGWDGYRFRSTTVAVARPVPGA